MAVNYDSIQKEVDNFSAISFDTDGKFAVHDSMHFQGMPLSTLESINKKIDRGLKSEYVKRVGNVSTLDEAIKSTKNHVSEALTNIAKGSVKLKDLITKDSYSNANLNINTANNPYTKSTASPNIWISPYEAATLYSQKGLPEIIINKKCKSILLNGVKIKNPKLSAKELDKITESMYAKGLTNIISDAVRDSLTYGGDLVYPMLKGDTPLSAAFDLKSLLKYGILKKNCIDWIVSLDRWNTMIIPPKHPTDKDFNNPDRYYIPFLGAWMNAQRCSRIVTSKQAGWYGALFTQGWGLSDFCGYIQEVLNYNITVATIPQMIQQMSMVVRSIDMDGVLAAEGINSLTEVLQTNSVVMNEVSNSNPINFDILGNLQVINRDFKELPSLIRILRQDLASKAAIPEPMLFSSEKGNFSSGDDTEGNLTKQWEAVKYIHKDVEQQFKPLAKILTIDALGTDSHILEALPYTQIHFDTPVISNASERAEIGKNLSQAFFNFVGGQMPMDKAIQITSNFAGDDLSISSEVIDELKELQAIQTKLANESKELDNDVKEQQIKNMKEGISSGGPGGVPGAPKSAGSSGKESEGYSRIEQKQHETTRGSTKRQERLTKSQNDPVAYKQARNSTEK